MHVGSDLLKLNEIKFRIYCYLFVRSLYFSNFRLKRIEDFSLYQITSRLKSLVANRVEIHNLMSICLIFNKTILSRKARICHED